MNICPRIVCCALVGWFGLLCDADVMRFELETFDHKSGTLTNKLSGLPSVNICPGIVCCALIGWFGLLCDADVTGFELATFRS